MKAEQIRPDDDIAEYVRLHAADAALILERSDDFVDVPCPACAGRSGETAFCKSGFRFVECRSCQTLYVSPRPAPPLLEMFYNEASSFALYSEKIFPESEEARRGMIFAPRARRLAGLCEKHGIPSGALLYDVGAGWGTFAEEARKLGYFGRVVAVEPSARLAASCRAKGVEIIESTVEGAGIHSADVVTSFELIEHLFDPESFLRSCAAALSENGLLVLTCPNVKGFDLQLLGPLSENVDGPEHLNYFHPDSLSLLLGRCGFSVLEVLTPGKLDAELVRKKVLDGALELPDAFLRRVLVDEWDRLGGPFQSFLAENGLSSHLWVAARAA